MEVIRRKTAALFQGACRVSALISDADPVRENALADYGFNLGMAFQMVDDLIDYTQQTATLGKRTGADLREGKLTLPVIHALKNAPDADRTPMEAIIRNRDFSTRDFQQLLTMLEKYGGLAYTRSLAAQRVAAAKAALSAFSDSQTKQILLGLADYALERDR
jgi:octaprenyl-diphosphate synthase